MRTLLVSLRLAWHNLMLNKVRSLLTLLGMIIGVGAVISIVSLGEGLRHQFSQNMSSFGGDTMFMTPKEVKRPGLAPRQGELFKQADLDAVVEECPSVQSIRPGIDAGVVAKYHDRVKSGHVLGTYPSYVEDGGDKLADGRYFTQAETAAAARVCVIGHDMANDLFGETRDYGNPIGKYVKLNGINYLIIGLFEKRKNMFNGAPNVDTGFAAPTTTVQLRIMGSKEVFWVEVQLKKGAVLAQAKDEVSEVMRKRRSIRNATDDDFQIITPDDFMKIGNQFINVLVGIFGSIAFMSLLVGGVGIMNIMLVSVTERTREIGLRMALGAGRPMVLTQFLVEAITLTLIGGLIGIAVGFGGASAVAGVLQNMMGENWSAHMPLQWLIAAITVSMLVGVIFGTYPALKASQLDPVEAMRYE
jgi:ABC-type antimicrobial peptide transport system permease subunit